jgi:hypothetical protein
VGNALGKRPPGRPRWRWTDLLPESTNTTTNWSTYFYHTQNPPLYISQNWISYTESTDVSGSPSVEQIPAAQFHICVSKITPNIPNSDSRHFCGPAARFLNGR